MTIINPSFGVRSYWHLVDDAPMEDDASAAESLLKIVTEHDHLPANRWPIDQVVVRAMAVELAVSMAASGHALPNQLVLLLAWAAAVPNLALQDPPAFFDGGWRGGSAAKRPNSKSLANALDREHFQKTGQMMPLERLRTTLVRLLGDEAPAWSSLKRWRGEQDYSDFVTFELSDPTTPSEA